MTAKYSPSPGFPITTNSLSRSVSRRVNPPVTSIIGFPDFYSDFWMYSPYVVISSEMTEKIITGFAKRLN